jgi:hypothetical protein
MGTGLSGGIEDRGAAQTEEEQATADEAKAVLESDEFRNAPALRRLLKFLVDTHLTGKSGDLKEYSIGVDALGRPETFDPKKDSIVRLQMGRLRQKLSEYYRTEGSEDPYIIEFPKASFVVRCSERPLPPPVAPARSGPSRYQILLFAAVALWAVVASGLLLKHYRNQALVESLWSPALDRLWTPMLSSTRSLVIAIEEPPFVQITGFGVYRELKLNHWKDIEASPNVDAIRRSLASPSISPNYYYAPMGEVSAAFLLGRLLGPRVPGLSLIGSRELSLRQLGNNDVIYLGISGFVTDILKSLPLQPDIAEAPGGISNQHATGDELKFYRDQTPAGPAGDGQAYALVTHLPGPAATGTFTTFTGSSSASRLAAVQYFTDPAHAEELTSRMSRGKSQMPRYYQVLLRVDFKDGVPTKTSWVLCHELKF